MNAIMPGFTAERALAARGAAHRMPHRAFDRLTGEVVPQQAPIGVGTGLGNTIDIEPEQCILRCRWKCTRYICYPTDCYWLCL